MDPQNTHEKKIQTHEAPKRKIFGSTNTMAQWHETQRTHNATRPTKFSTIIDLKLNLSLFHHCSLCQFPIFKTKFYGKANLNIFCCRANTVWKSDPRNCLSLWESLTQTKQNAYFLFSTIVFISEFRVEVYCDFRIALQILVNHIAF